MFVYFMITPVKYHLMSRQGFNIKDTIRTWYGVYQNETQIKTNTSSINFNINTSKQIKEPRKPINASPIYQKRQTERAVMFFSTSLELSLIEG